MRRHAQLWAYMLVPRYPSLAPGLWIHGCATYSSVSRLFAANPILDSVDLQLIDLQRRAPSRPSRRSPPSIRQSIRPSHDDTPRTSVKPTLLIYLIKALDHLGSVGASARPTLGLYARPQIPIARSRAVDPRVRDLYVSVAPDLCVSGRCQSVSA